MARRFDSLAQVCAAGFVFVAMRGASAAPTPSPTPATPAPRPAATCTPIPSTPTPAARPLPTVQGKEAAGKESATPKPTKSDEWTEARHLFEQLSPDQQSKFIDNLDQWKTMTPEEQELFRDRELFRREKIAEEIQNAINRSGLKLDDDERELFALRYTQERRKIEEALRKETDQKRQSMVGDMLSRLKGEFSGTAAPGKGGGQ